MNTYIDHDGYTWPVGPMNTRLSQDLYADLVAAIHIGRAYQARCERLEGENRALWAELNRLTLAS